METTTLFRVCDSGFRIGNEGKEERAQGPGLSIVRVEA